MPPPHLFPEALLFFQERPSGFQLARVLRNQVLHEQRDNTVAALRAHLRAALGAAAPLLYSKHIHFKAGKAHESRAEKKHRYTSACGSKKGSLGVLGGQLSGVSFMSCLDGLVFAASRVATTNDQRPMTNAEIIAYHEILQTPQSSEPRQTGAVTPC